MVVRMSYWKTISLRDGLQKPGIDDGEERNNGRKEINMSKKTLQLNIGREITMLSGPVPTVMGEKGPQPMTVGDLILQRIPIAASGTTDQAVRLWNIGLEMDKARGTFELSELDFELLKKSVLSGDMQVWAKVNLDRVFKDAKRGGVTNGEDAQKRNNQSVQRSKGSH